ncbi:hypothetical protein JCM11251_000783 [Rhodosporidiobolus azoricus]
MSLGAGHHQPQASNTTGARGLPRAKSLEGGLGVNDELHIEADHLSVEWWEDKLKEMDDEELHSTVQQLWTRLPPAERSILADYLETISSVPWADFKRGLREVREDRPGIDALKQFEADGSNWQNCLGVPGELESLLKRLLQAGGAAKKEGHFLFPAHGKASFMQQRVGQPQSIFTKMAQDTASGEKIAEELGGKIYPYFLSEHDDLAIDHDKIEMMLNITTGEAKVGNLAANSSRSGLGTEAFCAKDNGSDAPESFESWFQVSYDAADPSSDFWTFIRVISDGFAVRRNLGALIMPMSALFHLWVSQPDPLASFDGDTFRTFKRDKRETHAHRAREANKPSRAGIEALEAHKLRTERMTYTSAASTSAAIAERAKNPEVPPPVESVVVVSEEEQAELHQRARILQEKVKEVQEEYLVEQAEWVKKLSTNSNGKRQERPSGESEDKEVEEGGEVSESSDLLKEEEKKKK